MAKLEAALKKARELEWEGQHDEANAIRDRIHAAKEWLAHAGGERGSRGFWRTSRDGQPEKVKRRLAEMLREAEALAAREDYEAAKEVYAEAQALATEARSATTVRERRTEARGQSRRVERIRVRSVEEVKERIGGMLKKAEKLAAQGEYVDAKKIQALAQALAVEARHAFADAQALERESIRETRPERSRADRRERKPRPDRPELSLAQRSARSPTSPESMKDWQSKIEHILIAAENLRAAGMHQQADGLLEEVNSMKVKIDQSMKHRRGDRSEQHRDLANEVDALRDDVHELRAIVHEMMTRARSHSAGRE